MGQISVEIRRRPGSVPSGNQQERVLITPRGGETHRLPFPQQGLLADLDAELAYHLAGRAAEGLLLGTLSAGSGGPEFSDLAQATRLAVRIETSLGLGADGPLWTPAPVHELLREPGLRDRVQRRLEVAEARAGELLMSCRELLDDMARALAAQRELAGKDLAYWLDRIRAHAVIGQTGHRGGPLLCSRRRPSWGIRSTRRRPANWSRGTARDKTPSFNSHPGDPS